MKTVHHPSSILVAKVSGTEHLARIRFGNSALSFNTQVAISKIFCTTWNGLINIRRWVRSNVIEILLKPALICSAGFHEISQFCAVASANWLLYRVTDFKPPHLQIR